MSVAPDYTLARRSLVSNLEDNVRTDYPSVDVLYTGPVDMDAVSSPFIFVDMRWDRARATGVGVNANIRVHGSMALCIYGRETGGTALQNELLGYLTALFSNKDLGNAVTVVATPGKYEAHHGWNQQELLVPFWFDSVA